MLTITHLLLLPHLLQHQLQLQHLLPRQHRQTLPRARRLRPQLVPANSPTTRSTRTDFHLSRLTRGRLPTLLRLSTIVGKLHTLRATALAGSEEFRETQAPISTLFQKVSGTVCGLQFTWTIKLLLMICINIANNILTLEDSWIGKSTKLVMLVVLMLPLMLIRILQLHSYLLTCNGAALVRLITKLKLPT